MGEPRFDPDQALALAAVMEDEAFLRKVGLRKVALRKGRSST